MSESGDVAEDLEDLDAKALADKLVASMSGLADDSFDADLKRSDTGRYLLKQTRERQRDVAIALAGLIEQSRNNPNSDHLLLITSLTAQGCMRALLRRKLPFLDKDLRLIFEWLTRAELPIVWTLAPRITSTLEQFAKRETPSSQLIDVATQVSNKLFNVEDSDCRRYGKRIADALGLESTLPLVRGDIWAEAAAKDLRALPQEQFIAWSQLLAHCQTASAGKPSGKWLKTAKPLVEDGVTFREFFKFFEKWLPLLDEPATPEMREDWSPHSVGGNPQLFLDGNHDILKGLAWCCSLSPDPVAAKMLASLCSVGFKMIPIVGQRAPRLGNACIYSLGTLGGPEALAQLALLKARIKNRSTQNQIAKALQVAAKREGVTPEELEEMSVPEYGLTSKGILEETMGEFTARLAIVGHNSTKFEWINADGKIQKSVPAVVKSDFAEELKAFRTTIKDIQKMLSAVRERIDGFYLQQRSWPYAIWKEYYRDHPLVGFLAKSLIWSFEKNSKTVTTIFHEGKFVDHRGKPVEPPKDEDNKTVVRLWHPLDSDTPDVIAWRNWLEEQLVQQPFKQAHREIYLLTDAERTTDTYSNRYAAHIIKQDQFNALSRVRGWKYADQKIVDDGNPLASKILGNWDIRAEYWLEEIDDGVGTYRSDGRSYRYLSTDQVRFYPFDASRQTTRGRGGGFGLVWVDPMPLAEVPKLVFSEIMRDVDLFVGVSSVANDPTWSDGGPGGHFRDYWHNYSFGELSVTAKSRKEILEGLLPRLKIAKQSNIDGKFLVVEGSKHTYKIHLGSGNILMEPGNQYLCIVPDVYQQATVPHFFLPFEGDNVLAIILSKAFLLADDQKIKDRTILAQIGR